MKRDPLRTAFAFVLLFGLQAKADSPPASIDVSFRENQKGPVAGHYLKGTPIIGDYANPQFPESTHFDSQSGYLYVSNIHGLGMARDGNGWIGRVRMDKPESIEPWVKGLNGPKGLRAHQGVLWVADIDEVVGISIAEANIVKRIKIEGARFLNDVAIDGDGRIYVSDTFTNTIHRITGDSHEVWDSGPHLDGPNGLLVDGDKLVVASLGPTGPDFRPKSLGRLFAIDLKTKERSVIHKEPFGNLDGLEKYDENHYLTSDWQQGKIFLVTKNGGSRLLISGILGAADIGYDPTRKWVAIPRMGEDRVSIIAIDGAVDGTSKPMAVKVKLDSKWEKGRVLTSACVACHGQVDNGGWPSLNGQGRDYLIKALKDFRQGSRENPLMSTMAKPLSDEDIEALATYYSSRIQAPKMAQADMKKSPEKAATCAACHGTAGSSPNPLWPHLSAQKKDYLAKALKDFRQGTRTDPAMAPMAKSLTDEEIDALASFFAVQVRATQKSR